TKNKRRRRRSLTRNDDGSWAREGSNQSNSQTVYIRIPFSVMSGNESPSSTDTVAPNDSPTYKLIDGVPNLTEIRKRKSYAMLYDNRTKNAAWVYEILNSETLKQEVERQNVFSVDPSIHPFYQASNIRYQNDYVRGHLAAAANHRWCKKALEDTFLMSNISPQHKDLNNGRWKLLEQEYHTKAKDNQNDIRNVHVYSGPLYLPRDNSGVVKYKEMRGQAVPTHFFKVIIVEHCDGTVELKCYGMPNEESEHYTVSIEDIERASGLIFRENSCSKGETDSDREITHCK
uniref:Endonuclease n=1 Tax=Cyprinus carpio TaxID=7962 RepID=A0A8C1WRE0_CYPCA